MVRLDSSVIDALVHGRIDPRIYTFLTHTVPRFVKVGETRRGVSVRIGEWRDKGFAIDDSDVRDWSAALADGVFFRDHAVHAYLEHIAHMERLSREQLKSLPSAAEGDTPYSSEFFRYAPDGLPAAADIDVASENVVRAIEDIRRYHGHRDSSARAYTIYDVTAEATAQDRARIEKTPRQNQQEAIERFVAATERIPSDGRTLLMYAVMRFGKTFTSLMCATKMDGGNGANLVVVVSAKKDVAAEWRNEVAGTKNFESYEFIDADDLKRNSDVIGLIERKSKKFVLFLTLQSFLRKKEWLNRLFKRRIDLLIVDETHFGARAPKLGAPIAGETASQRKLRQDIDSDDDVRGAVDSSEEEETVRQISLNARVRLHLSGTPYRILMRGEFAPKDIIAFCQYADVIDAQAKWNADNLDRVNPATGRKFDESDNPYFGFPQMIRFAFNPNPAALARIKAMRSEGRSCSFADIFEPELAMDGNFTGAFAHKAEVAEFLRILDGSDEGEGVGFLSLLNHPKIIAGKLCRHVVMVLPRRASCDAMARELASGKYRTLGEYVVLNVSGHDRPAAYASPSAVKSDIAKYAAEGRKTLTLTVNRMLTGSTVPEWDTMIFLKDTRSPQEYDQSIFRLQNPYVQTLSASAGAASSDAPAVFRHNLKPQTLLVDFNPGRMFALQELRGQIHNANAGESDMEKLEARIRRELEISPIVFFNKDKLRQAEYIDVVNEVLKYSGSRGVTEEVLELDVDLDALVADRRLREIVERENPLDSKNGFEKKAAAGDGEALDDGGDGGESAADSHLNSREGERGDDSDAALASKFRAYYRRVLFYAFLADSCGREIGSLNELHDSIKGAENIRIARSLEIEKADLKRLFKVRPAVLSGLEYAIRRMSRLSNERRDGADPVERARIAMQKFGRLGKAQIVAPESVADMVIGARPDVAWSDFLPDDEFAGIVDDGGRFLDVAGKTGEFAIALYRRSRRLRPNADLSQRICTIPTSKVAYEFTRRVYRDLGLSVDCIATFTSYDLLEALGKKPTPADYARIRALLSQRKPFCRISMKDKVSMKNILSKDRPFPFALATGNPPYQVESTGNNESDTPIYHYFIDAAGGVSSRAGLVHPARFLFNAGATPKGWNEKMLNSPHVKVVLYEGDSTKTFPDTAISGGVAITYQNSEQEFDKIGVFTAFPELNSILRKVQATNGGSMMDVVTNRGVYRYSELAYAERPDEMKKTADPRIGPSAFERMPSLFTEEKPDDEHDYVRIYGNLNGKRTYRWLRRDYVKPVENLDKFKVFISKADGAAGQIGKPVPARIIGRPVVVEPGVGCTETYIAIGGQNAIEEACAIAKYVQTRFLRTMIGVLKVTQNYAQPTWRYVPLQDFTAASDIDWAKSIPEIDVKLYNKYGLTQTEREFIESHVCPMG